MSKSSRTLYERLRDEANQTSQSATALTIALRWTILIAAVLIITALLPGSGGEADQQAYDHTLLGTTWAQDNVVADYAYPVPKRPHDLQAELDSAARYAPTVFRTRMVSAEMVQHRIAKARSVVGQESAQWFAKYTGQIIKVCTAPYITNIRNESSASSTVLIIAADGAATMVDRAVVTSLQAVQDQVASMASSAPATIGNELRTALRDVPMPTLIYDGTATAHERTVSKSSVSTTLEIVRSGEVIVRKGQRVNEQVLARLMAYRNAQYIRSAVQLNIFAIIGSFGHAALIVGFVGLYLFFLRPASFSSLGQLGTLVGLPVFCALLGWLSVRLDPILPVEYAIVVPALSMIITILYEARTALFITVAMAFAVGAARGDDYGTVVVLLVGGMLGVYSARNVHSRTQIFTSIVAVFLGLVVAVVAIDLERGAPIQWMWPKLVMAAANAVVSPLLTFGIILAFERIFNVATDLRLEEFNNLNHELLRKLNERAPGTYQHTLAVARLSEAAAQAIGANVLLTRVGAYFHDVGKIEKSEYFVENQIDIENKHDRLPPRKSVAIIRQHVQDGIELAATYKLPDRIAQFIPMHHGTILIKHFYAAAVEEARLTENATVDPQDFRYPGPRPTSKETGIVMLADAVEAVSRLVDTAQRDQIEAAVDKIILDRIADEQLANTPLTMHDLALVKDAFVRNLLGTTHQRVRYKEVQQTPRST